MAFLCVESVGKTHFKIFPNPCSGAVHLRYSISETRNLKFELFSIQGVKMMTILDEITQAGEYDLEFDVSNMPSGMYFIKMQSEDSHVTVKLVVMH